MAIPSPDLYKSYFDDPTLSDLTLKLSDRTVHVHRIVLCRASEYFTSLLAWRFQESTSKEVDLHDDDPEAMMALLAHIYGQPYSYVEGDDPLNKLALLFVAAEKYQLLSGLQEKIYRRFTGKIESHVFDPEDFFNAVRTIFDSTSQNSLARAWIVDGCANHLAEFREDRDFVALLKDFPDSSIAILTSHYLACAFSSGWQCESGLIEDCVTCDGVPTCSYKNTEVEKACGYEFTRLYAWRRHNVMNWLCPSCGHTSRPVCSSCKGHGAWGGRCFDRIA